VTGTPASVGYQPSRPELRMLGAVARQSICDAWLRGADRTVFHGYSIETRRIGRAGDGCPLLVLTLRATGVGDVLDRLFIAVASHPIPGQHSTSASIGRALQRRAEPSLSLAVSARLMRVTHRPNPVRSPENREPQGSEMLSVASTQSGSPIPALGVVSPFPCVPCP
jgi:hypothetical protein